MASNFYDHRIDAKTETRARSATNDKIFINNLRKHLLNSIFLAAIYKKFRAFDWIEAFRLNHTPSGWMDVRLTLFLIVCVCVLSR